MAEDTAGIKFLKDFSISGTASAFNIRVKFKTYLLYLIGFSGLLPTSFAHAAIDCRAVLQGVAKTFGFRPLQSNRKLEKSDADLMAHSYRHLDGGQPREAGQIKLLSADGEVLAQTELGLGGVGWINLNNPTIELLKENMQNLEKVKTISITHTHPQYLSSTSRRGLYSKFSQSDLNADQALFQELKQFPELKNVTLESAIIFLQSGPYKDLNEGISAKELKPFLRVKSYVLQK